VVRARHENVDRLLTALVWAGICLALATAAIYGLTRPNAAVLAKRLWPWLVALAATIWLFLLPAGMLGFILLVIALSVLIARSQKQPTTDSGTTGVEGATR
jgi:hypothetical protein